MKYYQTKLEYPWMKYILVNHWSLNEMRVFFALYQHNFVDPVTGKKKNRVFLSTNSISLLTGIERRNVGRFIKKLVNKKVLKIKHDYKDGSFVNNIYYISLPEFVDPEDTKNNQFCFLNKSDMKMLCTARDVDDSLSAPTKYSKVQYRIFLTCMVNFPKYPPRTIRKLGRTLYTNNFNNQNLVEEIKEIFEIENKNTRDIFSMIQSIKEVRDSRAQDNKNALRAKILKAKAEQNNEDEEDIDD